MKVYTKEKSEEALFKVGIVGERINNMEKITVKEVNGYKVEKYANTRGQYFVNIREGNGFREFHTFRTIKDAVKFIETAL